MNLFWFYDEHRLLPNQDLSGTLHPAIGNLSSLLYMWVVTIKSSQIIVINFR